ncbi:hypothetical protein J4N46_00605 [Capnocytophaga sp. Marseille-Q4570]|uniref:Uncharacterized protein n=1 Tax=Capnocytophaga bilenii TaxID=2819369 RepID=A0ABS3PUI5_9FLAO|nr:hypothetical protein [Capnocytophaga bilenii]MBO1882971.1 hypothetical protein [Capnocytophaga bilenii]
MFNYQYLMIIFSIYQFIILPSEPSAKDERRISEGKSASWRSRVCDEG